MKKIVVALSVVLVVMGMISMAQAEVRYEHFIQGSRYVGTNEANESIYEDYYEVTIVTDASEEKVELTKEEYEELYNKYARTSYLCIFGFSIKLP